ARVDAEIAPDRSGVAERRRGNQAGRLRVTRESGVEMLAARRRGQRDTRVDNALVGSVVDRARKEIETDQSVDLELAALQLGKQVRAYGEANGERAEVSGSARRLARLF